VTGEERGAHLGDQFLLREEAEGPGAAVRAGEAGHCPDAKPEGELWVPGDAPSLALHWAVEALAKAGTLSIIGVYPPNLETWPS
jgi:threonine dehydrogenase-like Zn-dependent dehydrogenase